ncbi:MAG: MATE family efflux transporter [Propionibacteriaceae bacterium]|nr:MATE family efflux transporter [Propionibacteriaceae bacterium]
MNDLTSGSPLRLIVLFTIPLLVGNLFQQLYLFTDAVVVGRLIGVNALAAVGATGSLTFLLIGFTWGSSAGLAIPVAKAFGANDHRELRRSVAAAVYASIGIALFIMVAGCLGAAPMLRLLNTPPELMRPATDFLYVTFGGAAVTVAFNLLAALIRALGDSRTPLYFLVISTVLNAGLSALFVGVFHLGVAGAAAATIVAQGVAVTGCLMLISKKMPLLQVHGREWRLSPAYVWDSARLGIAMGFQMSIIAIGSVVLQYAVNGLGAHAIAAFTASARVDQLASAPLNSFGLALSTYVAQNRGARMWRRIRDGVSQTVLVSVGLAIVLGSVNVVFGATFVRLFVGSGQPDVVADAHQYLIIQGVTYTILGLLFALRGTIQGLGKAAVPTVAGAMELLLRATAGLVLVSHFGFLGVCLASPLAWVGSMSALVPAWFYFRRRLVVQEWAQVTPGRRTGVPAVGKPVSAGTAVEAPRQPAVVYA